MVHGYGADAKWFATLAEIDEVFATRVREAGCVDCGGPLDRADYERKPRGDLGEGTDAYTRRRSFCCRRDGCRHRATPPSVRFLGRKVYVAALVVIASVLGRHRALVGRGAPRRVEGVPVRTVRRWLAFWSVTFALTAFWKEAKGIPGESRGGGDVARVAPRTLRRAERDDDAHAPAPVDRADHDDVGSSGDRDARVSPRRRWRLC